MANPLASLSKGATVFAGSAKAKLVRLRDELAPLAARYDVMVANPPYMGGNNMNRWLNGWCKKNYPDTCRDLCTCFVGRGIGLASRGGYEALITSDTCMYISSFEKMRRMVIDETTIVAFIDTRGTNAHPDVFDANAGWVLWMGKADHMEGAYFKLSQSIAEKESRYLEALADPGCGWFYRRNVEAFEAIPGSPIAYWLPKSIIASFDEGISIDDLSDFTGSQNITGDNNRYLRFWWEVDVSSVGKVGQWIPYAKGGDYRRWYGNIDHVLDCRDEAIRFYRGNPTSNLLNERYWYVEGITYNAITSGRPHFRYLPAGCSFDKGGPSIVRLGKHRLATLGFLNSTTCEIFLSAMNPTLNLQVKDIKTLPVLVRRIAITSIDELVNNCIILSSMDWQLRETASNRFVRNPLL